MSSPALSFMVVSTSCCQNKVKLSNNYIRTVVLRWICVREGTVCHFLTGYRNFSLGKGPVTHKFVESQQKSRVKQKPLNDLLHAYSCFVRQSCVFGDFHVVDEETAPTRTEKRIRFLLRTYTNKK